MGVLFNYKSLRWNEAYENLGAIIQPEIDIAVPEDLNPWEFYQKNTRLKISKTFHGYDDNSVKEKI